MNLHQLLSKRTLKCAQEEAGEHLAQGGNTWDIIQIFRVMDFKQISL